MPAGIDQIASFLRVGITLGLVEPRDAIRFADSLIASTERPRLEWLNLATTHPTESAAVEALGSLTNSALSAPVSRQVAEALLDVVREDLLSGRRDLPEVISLVDRLSHFIDVDDDFRWELVALADDYSLVQEGQYGDLPTMSSIARDFLSRFDGASADFRVAAA